jgi:hypothetical protein
MLVRKHLGRPTKVLPIMREYALALVVFLVVWTPFGLKQVEVKINISGDLVDQPDLNIVDAMCK